MLRANLWVAAGLVNGATSTISYQSGGLPDLPTAVMISFDSYCGALKSHGTLKALLDGRWHYTTAIFETSIGRKNAQGTSFVLNKVVVVPKNFVQASLLLLDHLYGIIFRPSFDYGHVFSMPNNVRLQDHEAEDHRLQLLHRNC